MSRVEGKQHLRLKMKGYLVINIKFPHEIEMKYYSYQADSKKSVSFFAVDEISESLTVDN